MPSQRQKAAAFRRQAKCLEQLACVPPWRDRKELTLFPQRGYILNEPWISLHLSCAIQPITVGIFTKWAQICLRFACYYHWLNSQPIIKSEYNSASCFIFTEPVLDQITTIHFLWSALTFTWFCWRICLPSRYLSHIQQFSLDPSAQCILYYTVYCIGGYTDICIGS